MLPWFGVTFGPAFWRRIWGVGRRAAPHLTSEQAEILAALKLPSC
jgi:hypothetical protein